MDETRARAVLAQPNEYTHVDQRAAAVAVLAKLDAARAREAELEAENRQLRMRLDEMDIRAGEVLDSPVVDGRTSVRPEYVEALRATMQRPIDQEEMPR